MSNETQDKLLKRIESGYSLPALSPVAVKLVELASDDNCSLNDLLSLVQQDPSLAANLLKMANSAFFKAGQPVSTLQQAIMRIGFHQIRVMCLSISLRNTFPMGKIGAFDYEHFWRTSLYRAVVAKLIAGKLKTCTPEESFVAGLILEVGFLIFYDLHLKGKNFDGIPDVSSLDELLVWEEEHYGIQHRAIGELALRYWKFPEKIVDSQGLYGETAIAENALPLARICELARTVSVDMLQKEADFRQIFTVARQSCGISEETMNDIILMAFEQVEAIASSLKLGLDKERDLIELIEKANQSLGRISERINAYQDALQQYALPAFEALNAKKKDKTIEYTLDAIAHEIRNPLVAVAGFARKLSKSIDPVSKSGKYVRIILEESKRLETALDEMTVKP